jgi:integrase
MASASIYIPGKVYTDGTVGVYLRIIHNRKIHLRQLCRVMPGEIDHKKQEVRGRTGEAYRLNSLINKSLADAKEYLIDCQIKKIEPDPIGYFNSGKRGETIVDHIRERAAVMEANGSYRTSAKHISTANRIELLKMDVSIISITGAWVRKFDTELIRIGNNPNTRAKHMSVISAVIRERDGVSNPFERYRKPANEVNKAKLSLAEVYAIEGEELTGRLAVVRDLFVFAIYARGMRAFDVLTLTWDKIQDGRLVYKTSKGRQSGKGKDMDILVTEKMGAIIDRYRGRTEIPAHHLPGRYTGQNQYGGAGYTDPAYVFPILVISPGVYLSNEKRYLNYVNKIAVGINTQLRAVAAAAGIRKHISMHVARHTFAAIMDEARAPLATIQQLLGHSKIETTARYVQQLRKSSELDEAVDGVF